MRRLCQESSTHKRHVTDVYRTKNDNRQNAFRNKSKDNTTLERSSYTDISGDADDVSVY